MPDEPELKQYRLRIRATARVENEDTVTAATLEEATAKAAAVDLDDYRWGYRYNSDDGVEGDELIYLTEVGNDTDDEIEVDRRREGDPFSWTACDIVKDLAKLYTRTLESSVDDVRSLIARAHDACTKSEAGEEAN